MAAGANQRKPSRPGQAGGAGQADRSRPRKPAPQGGDVSDHAEIGGVELALAFLNLPQWKKEAEDWVNTAPREIREIRNYFKGDCAAGFWFRLDPVTDLDPSLSAPGSLRTIIEEYAKSRCSIPSCEEMRVAIEEKGMAEWKVLSPIAKSRFIDKLWRSWGQGDTSTLEFRLLDLEKWLLPFAQSAEYLDPPKKKAGRPSMHGATHPGAPKEVGRPEFQFGFRLAVLWNRFGGKLEAMNGRNRPEVVQLPGESTGAEEKRKNLEVGKPQTPFEEFVECCLNAAREYVMKNDLSAFFPAFRTIRDEGLGPALRDFHRILKEDHRKDLEAELRDWR